MPPGGRYQLPLGSVLNHVLLHQSIIGLECLEQFKLIDDYPDVVIGCCGGGAALAASPSPFCMKIRKIKMCA